jgi:hypothetical protein
VFASANVLESANAEANAIVAIFMGTSFSSFRQDGYLVALFGRSIKIFFKESSLSAESNHIDRVITRAGP